MLYWIGQVQQDHGCKINLQFTVIVTFLTAIINVYYVQGNPSKYNSS